MDECDGCGWGWDLSGDTFEMTIRYNPEHRIIVCYVCYCTLIVGRPISQESRQINWGTNYIASLIKGDK